MSRINFEFQGPLQMTEVFRETRKTSTTPQKPSALRELDGFEEGAGFDLVIKREDELQLPPDFERGGQVRTLRTTVTHNSGSGYSPRPGRTQLLQESRQAFAAPYHEYASAYRAEPQLQQQQPYRSAHFASSYRSANPFHAETEQLRDPLIRSDYRSPYNHLTNSQAQQRSRQASPLRAASPFRQTSTFLIDGHSLARAHDHLDRLDDLARSQERDINLLLGHTGPRHDRLLARGLSPARSTQLLDRSADRLLRTDPAGFRGTLDGTGLPGHEVVYHDADLLPKLLTDYPELRKKELEFRRLNEEKDINDSLLSISKNLLEEAKASLTRIRGASAIRSSTPSRSAKNSPVKPGTSSSYSSIRLNNVDSEKKHLRDDHRIDLDKAPNSQHQTPAKLPPATLPATPSKPPLRPAPAPPAPPAPTPSYTYTYGYGAATSSPGRPTAPADPPSLKPVPVVQTGSFSVSPVPPPPIATIVNSSTKTTEKFTAAVPPPPPITSTVTSYSRTSQNTTAVPPPPPLQSRPIPPPPPLVPSAPKPPVNERQSLVDRSSQGFSASSAPNQTQLDQRIGSQITPSSYQRHSSSTQGAGPDGLGQRTTEVKEDKKVSPDGTVTTTVKRTTVTTSNYEDDNPSNTGNTGTAAQLARQTDPVRATFTSSSYNYDLPPVQGRPFPRS